jgi:integrase
MQYRFKTLLVKIGLRYINFHSLRHLFATNCVELGFDVKTLSEILGHSTVEITLNRYVHSSMERKRQCMDMLSIDVA